MDQELKAYLDENFGRIETAVRHTQVSVEALRSDLQLVAEGVMGGTERLEAFQAETARGFQEVKASLSPYYQNLNGRLQGLHDDVQSLDRRMRVLESRADRQTEDVLDVIRRKFGKQQA